MTNRLTFYDLVTIVVISITKYTAVLLMFNLLFLTFFQNEVKDFRRNHKP